MGEREEILLSGEKAKWLRDRVAHGTIDLALHGWNHRTDQRSPPPAPSEYRGLAFEVQLANLRRGADHLEATLDTRCTTFIPPWNSYDKNTVRALEECGFECLSASSTGASPRGSRLHYLPTSCELHELRAAIGAAYASGDSDAIIGVLMHPYDFRESDDARARYDLPTFERLLEELRAMPLVELTSVSRLRASARDLNVARYRANGPSALDLLSPPALRRRGRGVWYASTRVARRAGRVRGAATLAYYVALIGISWILGSWLVRLVPARLSPLLWLVSAVLFIAMLAIAVRAIVAGRLYYRSMTALSMQGGFLSALLSL